MRLPGYTPKVVLAVLLLLFVALLAINIVRSDTTTPEKHAKTFFENLYHGNYAAAYNESCAVQRAHISAQDFASESKPSIDQQLAVTGALQTVEVTGSKLHSNNTATVELKLTFAKKLAYMQISMDKAGGWTACGFEGVDHSGVVK